MLFIGKIELIFSNIQTHYIFNVEKSLKVSKDKDYKKSVSFNKIGGNT
jgi:hypothetical protein